MNSLELIIPATSPDKAALLSPPPDQLAVWLDALNLVNAEDSSAQVINALTSYNQSGMQVSERMSALEQFIPVVEQLVETLRNSYRGSTFPLVNKQQAHADLVSRLIDAMSVGHKIAAVALSQAGDSVDNDELAHSIILAIHYLGEKILAAYLVYMPVEKNTWYELYQLYQFAEQHELTREAPVIQAMAFPENTTIGLVFKRIVMLSLANPYHLMEGDAASVYRNLLEWGIYVSLIPLKNTAAVEGKFYLDLAVDSPPGFASGHTSHAPVNGRVLDVGRIVEGIGSLIQSISDKADDNSMTLKDRMNRDMLVRLQSVWGGRAERQFDRAPHSAMVSLAAGLTASHYLIGGEQVFQPEKNELNLKKTGGIDTSGLSLTPLGDESWRNEERAERIEQGVVEHRVSRFDPDAAHKDTWGKVHSHKVLANKTDEPDVPVFQVQQWHVVNTSAQGEGLLCDDPTGIRIRVGDVVALRRAEAEPWNLAVVRWFGMTQEKKLESGLMNIPGLVQAVGTRAVGGTGEGGEYFRGMLIKESGKTDALLVSAMIYDLGTELLISTTTEVLYARLIWLIDTTTSYTRFGIEYFEPE